MAGALPDPEMPALTIADLGILRDVRVDSSGHVDIDITPTYSGCPALETIREGAAEAGERDSDQPRQAAARSQRLAAAPSVSPEHQSGLGPMRYYGGPKSPIWRAPAAN